MKNAKIEKTIEKIKKVDNIILQLLKDDEVKRVFLKIMLKKDIGKNLMKVYYDPK
jgi:hypothetical protein